MQRSIIVIAVLAACVVLAATFLMGGPRAFVASGEADRPLPAPVVDEPLASAPGLKTAVVAGGCFWGIEAVFEHVKGVKSAESGYSGGAGATARYEDVSSGTTGHAESVRITYDPSQMTYGQLLEVFFSVAHDPTELNRQGPDTGTQYRSALFYVDADQKRIAEAYIAQLAAAKAFDAPIVTEVAPLEKFIPAEEYHQDFVAQNPGNRYVCANDLPKLAKLQKLYPGLYRAAK